MNSPNTLPILHMTGDILSDPKRRCVGTLAENKHRNPVSVTDDAACKFCLTGALSKAMSLIHPSATAQEQMSYYTSLKECLGIEDGYPAPEFWDSNEHLHDLIATKLREAK